MNCAILSYNGKVYFGFSGDVHAAPDLRRMEKLLLASFQELRDAVDLRKPEKQKEHKQRRAVPAAAAKAKRTPNVPVANVASPMEVKREPEPATIPEDNISPTQRVVA